jgi:hypothetical protein
MYYHHATVRQSASESWCTKYSVISSLKLMLLISPSLHHLPSFITITLTSQSVHYCDTQTFHRSEDDDDDAVLDFCIVYLSADANVLKEQTVSLFKHEDEDNMLL